MRSGWVVWLAAGAAAITACGDRTPLMSGMAGGAAGAPGADGGAAGAPGDPRVPDGGAAPSFQPLDINAEWRGAGCGKPLPTEQIPTIPGTPTGYTQFTVMGTGANLTNTPIAAKAGPRTFWVRVPADYDSNKAYRVVYVGQRCGGFDSANTNTFPLFNEARGGTEQAIYVALDIPKDMANMDCYDNRDGLQSQEWEAFQLFMQVVDTNYCADLNKIYVAGYTTGGWLANMWGCYFAGSPTPPRKFAPGYHIRAQAAVSGGEPDQQPTCGGPVAAFWIHNLVDNGNPIEGDIRALERVGRMNGCDTTYSDTTLQAPWHADVMAIGDDCKRFTGCSPNYPVVFCTPADPGPFIDVNVRIVVPGLKLFFDEIEAGRQ